MKKTFVNPEMNISLFEMENVLTVSGKGNLEAAKIAIGATSITEKDFGDLEFTF
jgi:hypothetical protein